MSTGLRRGRRSPTPRCDWLMRSVRSIWETTADCSSSPAIDRRHSWPTPPPHWERPHRCRSTSTSRPARSRTSPPNRERGWRSSTRRRSRRPATALAGTDVVIVELADQGIAGPGSTNSWPVISRSNCATISRSSRACCSPRVPRGDRRRSNCHRRPSVRRPRSPGSSSTARRIASPGSERISSSDRCITTAR